MINSNTKTNDKPRYRQIQDILKKQIQHGEIEIGEYLPSENELCACYKITRTTARKALEELQKEGFITRRHGKGSVVRERRDSLGLLTVKGFSEAVGQGIKTDFLQLPQISDWDFDLSFKPSEQERKTRCIYFSRLRYVNDNPVMVEDNWLSEEKVSQFTESAFVQDSFFKTLSQRYLIEIIGSEQELRALPATAGIARLLQIKEGTPVLHITVKYLTSIPGYYVYSQLFCNTNKYPIGNNYFMQ
ncbi:GntR family transcriptional regulator [uncultured Draconibacterium sp.]|uniref:GntR family transcriptional regulator n=1 Tax=uncultured Draconibacterium sp. TaxID=1573823 RepID=UPI003216D3B4